MLQQIRLLLTLPCRVVQLTLKHKSINLELLSLKLIYGNSLILHSLLLKLSLDKDVPMATSYSQLVRVLSVQSQGTFPGLCFATMKPKIPYVVYNALSTCKVSALPHIFMIALRAEPTQPTAFQRVRPNGN